MGYLICCVRCCILLGGTCDVPPYVFFSYQKQASPEVLDCSGVCLKRLNCAMESQTASNSRCLLEFRERKHCIFSLCLVYHVQQTIWGWQWEEFHSLKAQLNNLGAIWPAASVWSGTLWDSPLLALTPLFMKWFHELFRALFKPESSGEIEDEETGCLLPLLGAASSSISLHRWLAVQRAWMKESSSPPSSDWNYHFQLSQWQGFWGALA